MSGDRRAGLRPYQVRALDAVTAGLRDGGLGQLRMACGTGKTLVAARAAADLAATGVVVVLVPSIALAGQMITAVTAACPFGQVLAVCSDHTVGGGVPGVPGAGVPVSTDAEQLAKWLAGASGRVLAVGTYDSAHRLAEALALAGQVAELTVCDEAHRLAGRTDKFTAAVLKPGFLPERRRLYMTATPRIGTGRSAGGELVVASMDDEEVFGPVLHAYRFRQAIDDGWLKDYRIVVAAVTSRQVAELLDGGRELVGDGDVPVRMAAAQAALAMTAARFGLRRCLAFFPRIAHARRFTATLPGTLGMLAPDQRPAGAVSAGFVHGQMTSAQRDLVLDRLRRPPDGGWSVVANARCLGEGIDVPAIDSVLFGSPKTSVIDIVQAVGRALRRHDGSQVATIIVPALVPGPEDAGGDDAGAGWDAGAGGRYENVLRVVRAMCAHDEDLTAALNAARRAAGTGEPRELPAAITVLAPPGAIRQALDALAIHVVDGTTSPWHEGCSQARAYHGEHGHLDVPSAYTCAGGFPLGRWLCEQRSLRNRDMLAADRAALLEELGMAWDAHEHNWQRTYREALGFRAQHGHLQVPDGYRTPSGTRLDSWLAHQLAAWRAGTLPPPRIALLEQAGLRADTASTRWAEQLAALAAAITAHGGQRNLPPGSDQARWLDRQRAAFHQATLAAGKITMLREAGVTLSRDDLWHDTYQALARFRAAHGHFRVPKGTTTPAGTDLEHWQRTQRRSRGNGTLPPDKEKLLDAIGFPWNPRQHAWQARYHDLKAFRDEHGHLRVPARTPLAKWFGEQCKLADTGQLAPERLTALTGLDPHWRGAAPPAPAPPPQPETP